MIEAKVRQELEKAEAAQRKTGRVPSLHTTGPSEFIRLGLELEETQYVTPFYSITRVLTTQQEKTASHGQGAKQHSRQPSKYFLEGSKVPVYEAHAGMGAC